ncbi:hypothetical protein SKAU_G00221020 [Synaphobranchus kaupii]|uniref:UPAR/Ly6 domain-containing protein n=1 Tax=Synaphobranchus kaupii TaxID=118154 RepID=A0A9Q1FAX6_SYNKA|nr:hypothetical protein SKAU_G00221020 [Synaphobranchus kaupii]
MNGVVVGGFTLALIVALGHALECYKCDIGFWDLCITTKTTCSPDEQCFSGVGQAARVIDIKMKGCLKPDECDQESTVEFSPNNTIYTMNKTCCATDLCNHAPGHLRLSPVTLTLATLASMLVAPAFF